MGRGKGLHKIIVPVQFVASKQAPLEHNDLQDNFLDPPGILDCMKQQKIRGPTIVADIWNQPRNERIFVAFNSRNQAIGVEGRRLASFIGSIARNSDLTPFIAEVWRRFPKKNKRDLLELVKSKFLIPANGES
ncbi:hypothetical protein Cni_G06394 [Canna indica]|uniref:Uncharacterized protein n=1 Tax=Canna indica TaxID=4628 RepID=A0AAQ3JX66_9LILI|nr:hypothetical protein Cni_G06394 [Canna indica]